MVVEETVNTDLLRLRDFQANDLITLIVLIILISLEIFLLKHPRNIKSKSLKTSIILPLIFWIIGIIYWIGHLFSSSITDGVLLDWGFYVYSFLLIFPFVGLISTIFSIYTLIKVKEKKIATINLIIKIIYTIVPIVLLLTFGIH